MKIKKLLLSASLIFIVLSANAQLFTPKGLSTDEAKLMEILGFKDEALSASISNTLLFEKAKENLRRAGLLARCDRLLKREGDLYQFDQELRKAVQRIVKKTNDGLLPFEQTLDVFKLRNRGMLWAISATSATEKQKLFAHLDSEAGRKTLQHSYAANVLNKYSDYTTDVNTGMQMVTAPIHLKNYFDQSGQLALLEQVVAKLMPNELVSFRKLKSIENYKEEDKKWLAPIAEAFERNSTSLLQSFYDILDERDLQRLIEFQENEFFKLIMDVREAQREESRLRWAALGAADKKPAALVTDFSNLRIGNRKDPRYNAFISMLINQKFPLTPDFEEQMFRVSPRKESDNEHLKFCPEAAKK